MQKKSEGGKITIAELVAILVCQLGIDAHYVMDIMTIYEAELYMEHSYLSSKENWEQTRLQLLVSAQANSKKRLKLQDILKFPWDGNGEKKSIDKKDIERLESKAKEIEKQWQKQI